VDPRTGLDDVEKRKFLTQPGPELRALAHPARSQSLYRRRYLGSAIPCTQYEKLISPFYFTDIKT
jgi:hypothetical protein